MAGLPEITSAAASGVRRSIKSQRVSAGLIIVVFAVIVAVRLPNVILEGGRFWAEEGVVYFTKAWYLPWFQDWFLFFNNYINFIANFATWTGLQLGGIAYAPAFTVIIALATQCLPVYVIVTHDFPWRRSIFLTALAALMCALPPLTSEVWMNTITSQFHLGLCAALIFASASNIPALFYTDCAILILGAVSGPVTDLLFPLFVIAAAVNRNPQSFIKAAILGAGFVIQFSTFLLQDHSMRGGRLSPDALLSIVSLHTIILQFTGIYVANLFAKYLTYANAANHFLWAGSLIFLIFYFTIALIALRIKNFILARLLVAGALISLVSFYEAFGGDFASLMVLQWGERYAFAPMAINGLLVVGLASISQRLISRMFLCLLCLMMLVGVKEYIRDRPLFDNGPPWLAQIPYWRTRPHGVLFVWPNKNWITRITPNHVIYTLAPKQSQ